MSQFGVLLGLLEESNSGPSRPKTGVINDLLGGLGLDVDTRHGEPRWIFDEAANESGHDSQREKLLCIAILRRTSTCWQLWRRLLTASISIKSEGHQRGSLGPTMELRRKKVGVLLRDRIHRPRLN